MKLKDRVAIVTGAATGIGQACAARLAAEGARLVISDLNEDAARSAAAGMAGDVVVIRSDASDPAQMDALVDETVRQFGRLDLLVNNVGFSINGMLADVSNEVWDKIIAGNLSSVFYGTRAALRHMVPAGRGSIINISSASSQGGAYNMGPYSAAKAAVNNLTKTAAVEYARTGVRVNCVAPGGGIETDALVRWMETLPGGRPSFERMSVRGKFGLPEEIAAAVLFLASDEASLINGAILPVDGGATARVPTVDLPKPA